MKQLRIKASLTVEAACVMPIFLYFMIAFLYFIQIFILQEQIQSAITRMGLDLSKSAYAYTSLVDQGKSNSEDDTNLEDLDLLEESDMIIDDLINVIWNGSVLKSYFVKYLDIQKINHSCIKNGFSGLDFYSSEVLSNSEDIDIIVRYQVKLPLSVFLVKDMQMVQRVKLRGWTGHQVPALYTIIREENEEDTIVYITETGTVYHTNRNCQHIKLTILSVVGIPTNLRNNSGGKYYPCESCCKEEGSASDINYITPDGVRYHRRKECSKIKRTVIEVKLSEVASRRLCSTCSKSK